jgi:hypothetical protein
MALSAQKRTTLPAAKKVVGVGMVMEVDSREVPAAVPSVTQSVRPRVISVATKRRRLPRGMKLLGLAPWRPGTISRISVVPAGVPSVRQSSAPLTPSSAEK